ncbi:MAG TPA: FAD-dependent oxidoreductase [Gemmatimonadaceae bacterium]|nr:FAD-dependent oxidoreductase [Gemmatimonadaceae bacterium]
MTRHTHASETDVIVVGAGPAGSSAAWHLAREGVHVTMLDRARFPRDKPCAEYLSPEASRILSAMGALEACEAAGAAHLAGMVIRAPSGARIRGEFAAANGFRAFRDRGLALRRPVLDSILLERARAAGVVVREGEQVISVLRDSRGAVCGVRVRGMGGRSDQEGADGARDTTDTEIRARLVIGADGLRSTIARRIGVARHALGPRRLAFIGHYRDVDEITDFGEMHVEREGYAGFADVGHGLTNVAVVVPRASVRDVVAGNPSAFLEGWIAARPHLAPRMAHAARATTVRVTGPFASHASRAWGRGVALVGDAADFFDPFTGEGIYAALRGGELLAPYAMESLASDRPRDADAALRAYDRARRRAFRGKWAIERLVALAVGAPALLDRAAATLEASPAMANLFVGVAGDFVPAREVLRPGYLARLVFGNLLRSRSSPLPLSP